MGTDMTIRVKLWSPYSSDLLRCGENHQAAKSPEQCSSHDTGSKSSFWCQVTPLPASIDCHWVNV